ncbi:PREDICTED: uncharacterized protein LOC109207473 [Nicotiana attenuata]|uniref:DUF3741 domain-containing protein n=1 Tax=Nicotiana attenuata TaxID=49451 RepID=A0A314KUC3_NICAT|nr:PREDICTED: uncharacterized protein LOC109207473 [Nicotiana attenuata]OIT32339.1 hypothetical protein A4A49_10199 [Nicotiana attenuata]
MLKRQDSLMASARRQKPLPPENHHVVKSIGCMSGIFQIISKYQTKTKRLTSGRKQGKSYSSSPRRASSPQKVVGKHEKDHLKVPRSPIISPDIRRTPNNSPGNVKKEPALVARLMGLEEIPPPADYRAEDDSNEINRRKLLQALAKCNDDLESIRKIIKSAERVSESGDSMERRRRPGRVCALDELTRSPFSKVKDSGRITQQQKPLRRINKLKAYETVDIIKTFTNNEPFQRKTAATASPICCSKAMIQSVEEVCYDIAWGQKRETGRIGLVLQDQICRDMIEELVKEMDQVFLRSLPFIACKKRLYF